MRVLKNYVHVVDKDGTAHVLAPGIPVPDWAAALVPNPKAWVDSVQSAPARSHTTVVPAVKPSVSEAPAGGSDGPEADGSTSPVKVPPRGGAGSGHQAWADYATAHGVAVTDEMKSRDDIIGALEAAGIATE